MAAQVITLTPQVRELVVRDKIKDIINIWNKGAMAWARRDLAEEIRVSLANLSGLGKTVGDLKLTYVARNRNSQPLILPVTEKHLQDIAEYHRRYKPPPPIPKPH